MTEVFTPSAPYVDTEAAELEAEFRKWAVRVDGRGKEHVSDAYSDWARKVRLAWEAKSEHARAYRERQRRENG